MHAASRRMEELKLSSAQVSAATMHLPDLQESLQTFRRLPLEKVLSDFRNSALMKLNACLQQQETFPGGPTQGPSMTELCAMSVHGLQARDALLNVVALCL